MMDHVTEDASLLGLARPQSALASLVLGWAGGLALLCLQVPLLLLHHQLQHCGRLLTAAFHVLFYLYILLGEVLSAGRNKGHLTINCLHWQQLKVDITRWKPE